MHANASTLTACRVLIGLCTFAANPAVAAMPPTYTCENERESFEDLVAASRKAGFDPDYKPLPESGISSQFREMRDGVKLSGYKISARDSADKLVAPRGYVLVFPGDALLAQQSIADLKTIARN